MKNLNKIMQSIFKGIIRPKILFLFAFFFSSQAIAELSVTFYDSRIPAHNNSSCTSSDGFGDTLAADSTDCLLYTSPSPRDKTVSRMPSSA